MVQNQILKFNSNWHKANQVKFLCELRSVWFLQGYVGNLYLNLGTTAPKSNPFEFPQMTNHLNGSLTHLIPKSLELRVVWSHKGYVGNLEPNLDTIASQIESLVQPNQIHQTLYPNTSFPISHSLIGNLKSRTTNWLDPLERVRRQLETLLKCSHKSKHSHISSNDFSFIIIGIKGCSLETRDCN